MEKTSVYFFLLFFIFLNLLPRSNWKLMLGYTKLWSNIPMGTFYTEFYFCFTEAVSVGKTELMVYLF